MVEQTRDEAQLQAEDRFCACCGVWISGGSAFPVCAECFTELQPGKVYI